jgi:hypothetical protein
LLEATEIPDFKNEGTELTKETKRKRGPTDWRRELTSVFFVAFVASFLRSGTSRFTFVASTTGNS